MTGRVANRVANSSFEVDGLTYYVSANENSTASLMGGKMGFSTRIWDAHAFTNGSGSGVTLTLHSADRDQASSNTTHVLSKHNLAYFPVCLLASVAHINMSEQKSCH